MAQQGFEMVRYADDFVILCRSPEEAANALALVQQWTAEAGLKLHPEKTNIVDARPMFLTFWATGSSGGVATRNEEPAEAQGRDPSEDETDLWGELDEDHQRSTPRLRGWFEYFKHSYRTTFSDLDGWIRMRLRSLLRKRMGNRDVAEGAITIAGPINSLPTVGCTA